MGGTDPAIRKPGSPGLPSSVDTQVSVHTQLGHALPAASTAVPVGLANTALPTAEFSSVGSLAVVAGARVRQYEMIRELGRGGMGMVWLARDTKLGRRVAVKFLLHTSRGVADRFLAEARATAQCNHDNIVIIHEVDEHEGTPYMVLELLEGHSLREVLKSGGRLGTARAIELALPIARALARAHELGIVHRDLKPENVFVCANGQVKVLDFGIAKALGAAAHAKKVGRAATHPGERISSADLRAELRAAVVEHTHEGAIVGTLPYMSPEQMGLGEVDHRSDLWSLGVMLFEMLAGRHPIDPLTTEALFANATSEAEMPAIRDAAPEVPDALALIVDACLRKPRDARPAQASDVVRKLESLAPTRAGRSLDDGECPYPGLAAFQESDAARFFGRAKEIARTVARIRELPIVGLIGPSGTGKSSLVRAGVGPALRASDPRSEIVTLRPGRQPLEALAAIVQQMTTSSSKDVRARVAEHRELANRLRTEPGYMGALLRTRARQHGGQILVFVDQFEELYTLVASAEERRAFTAALAGVADDPTAPLRVIVAMRSDFLDRVAEDARFADELTRGLVLLAPPDRASLRDALVAPLEAAGHRFESAAMIEDMLEALQSTPGALPLLQFAAAKLWDARDRGRKQITVSAYNAIGGIAGALATHADEVVGQMNAAAQKLAQRVFRVLVTPERTRAICELGDLQGLGAAPGEADRVVEQLVAARLLVVNGLGANASVEIVHESLIESWPALRRWLDEDEEDAQFVAQLAAAAKQWDAKARPTGLLWRGEAMEEARRWYALRPRELAPRDKAFLDAVFALAARGRRARRAALVGAFVLLGAIATAAMIAMISIRAARGRAEDALAEIKQHEVARAAAEQQKAQAESAEQRAVDDKVSAESAKTEAENKRAQAEAAEHDAEKATHAAIEKSRDELDRENKKLQAAVLDAERQRAKAEKTSEDLAAAKATLEKSAAAVQAENKRLKEKNDELQRLTTKLKGME